MNANLYALFQKNLPTDAKPFLKTEEGTILSYDVLDEMTGRYAAALAELGVEPGMRVVAQIEKSMAAVLLYLGCLRAGAVYVPLNTAYTDAELDYFLDDAEPRLVVVDPARAQRLAGPFIVETLDAHGQGSFAARVQKTVPSTRITTCGPDDTAAILYTSGTTGRSKGALLTHGNLASNALSLYRLWGWRNDDVLLHALPVFHVHGLFVALHCALLGGSSVWFLPRFDASTLLRLLPRSTVMMGVPTFYTRLLGEAMLTPELCAGMRLFISGSAPLLPDTFTAFERATGHRILERYGMTEAGMITSNPLAGERRPGTVGYALPGVAARICQEDGTPVETGDVGVLEIAGPNVCRGYWRKPEATAEAFRDDGYFITGDLATMEGDGRIVLVGRARDLIISGGYNIYPKEVEQAIDDIGGVIESAVIGVPHADLGEAVAAVVVRADATLTAEQVIASLADRIARFKQPRSVMFVDALPRNTMGKVQKNRLREMVAAESGAADGA